MGTRFKRYDTKTLLANPELRRRLIVESTIATQAREGIDITREQAENSYFVVTEGERASFFGLVPFRGETGDNDGRHLEFIRTLANYRSPVRSDVALRDFATIDDSPLAYDRLALLGSYFRNNPKLDPSFASAVQGLATADDSRFVRCWWEVPAQSTNNRPRWRPFAKGGSYSRFYSDVYLVIFWENDGEVLRAYDRSVVRNPDFYFRSGLSWPLRTQRGFNVRKLPKGCVFGHKGPGLFPKNEGQEWYLLGVLNSAPADALLRMLASFGSWEVGVVKKIPVPEATVADRKHVGTLAESLHDLKSAWDSGNEISTRFDRPWVIQTSTTHEARTLSTALDAVLECECQLEATLTQTYADLNTAVYRLYGIPDAVRAKIEAAIGERPPELVWPQMEGKDRDQKRREHVDRLLTYLVKQILTEDEDHLVCLQRVAHEPPLLDRLREKLAACFPGQDPSFLETEVVNELKKKTKGYHRAESLSEWLHDVFFETHNALYQQRPLLWHLASSQTRTEPGFACLVHAHHFDADALAKLRSVYIRDRIAVLKREAAQAGNDGKADLRFDLLALAEEVDAYDAKLALLQEGAHTGPEGGERDYRILTPWKSPEDRPQGWHPDVDDGIKVNLAPLARTKLLRINLKLGTTESDE
jgi:hypothetical protein